MITYETKGITSSYSDVIPFVLVICVKFRSSENN